MSQAIEIRKQDFTDGALRGIAFGYLVSAVLAMLMCAWPAHADTHAALLLLAGTLLIFASLTYAVGAFYSWASRRARGIEGDDA